MKTEYRGDSKMHKMKMIAILLMVAFTGLSANIHAQKEDNLSLRSTEELSSQQLSAGSKYTWNNIDLNSGEYDLITMDLNWNWVYSTCSANYEMGHDTAVYVNGSKVTGSDRIISTNSPSCGPNWREVEYGSDGGQDPNPGEGYEALYTPTKNSLVLDITNLASASGSYPVTVEHAGSKYTLESAPIIRAYKVCELYLIKSVAPHSIKQGQTTTVSIIVENTGTTEVTDIEVSDTLPPDLILVSGETSRTYKSLLPDDSREFQYTLQLNKTGTFDLDPAMASYSDEEGNYRTVTSKTSAITVISPTDPPITKQTASKSSSEISTASVHLHGEKTHVVLGEDILLKLSAVNKITKPVMTLQVILIPPSGMSVTSADFVKSGAGQYTSTYIIEPGIGRDIEVRIRPNQAGGFVVNGAVIYYFGDDKGNAEEHTLSLPITVRAVEKAGAEQTGIPPESDEASAPGFAAVVVVIGLLAAYLWRKGI